MRIAKRVFFPEVDIIIVGAINSIKTRVGIGWHIGNKTFDRYVFIQNAIDFEQKFGVVGNSGCVKMYVVLCCMYARIGAPTTNRCDGPPNNLCSAESNTACTDKPFC